ncbi:MAG: hypothetical protein RBS24_07275 [Bacilli bacterium]|nr:hypothetical protein [Bacilli bacterium]
MSQGESTTKGYEYKCLVDGYVGNMIESSIQNHGCPICSNTKVKIGINDIGTTHPHLMKFFKNKDDILKYTAHSGKEVLFICDICNTTKKSKIYNITNNGFKCMVCGDGSSYSERFLYSLLNQCNIEFVHEKILSKDFIRRYDIYFEYNNKKYIIETHGMQHYEQTSNKNFTKINDQKNIDVSKRLFAINNGIDFYIELDCRYSQKE